MGERQGHEHARAALVHQTGGQGRSQRGAHAEGARHQAGGGERAGELADEEQNRQAVDGERVRTARPI